MYLESNWERKQRQFRRQRHSFSCKQVEFQWWPYLEYQSMRCHWSWQSLRHCHMCRILLEYNRIRHYRSRLGRGQLGVSCRLRGILPRWRLSQCHRRRDRFIQRSAIQDGPRRYQWRRGWHNGRDRGWVWPQSSGHRSERGLERCILRLRQQL